MVRNGHDAIVPVAYVPPTSAAAGVEVLPLAGLLRRMRTHPTGRQAQRPDFHFLMTVDRGSVRHMVDFHDYVVACGEWLWVRPGQVQRFAELPARSAASGTVVMFPPGSVPATTTSGLLLDEPFGGTWWSPDHEDRAALSGALRHLAAEYDATGTPAAVRAEILQHLLTVLLLRLRGLEGPGPTDAASTSTFLRFRSAVEQGFTTHRDVAHYARRLGYAPRTLTRATRRAAGVGAKELIDRRVVLEAKRLLVHGEEPVASVAARLGFDDASNFVAFFSARAGVTPAVFRRESRAGTAGP